MSDDVFYGELNAKYATVKRFLPTLLRVVRFEGGKRKGSIATDESNSMAQDGIAWAGSFRHWGKEKEICSWTERWKDKRTARKEGQQREHPDGNEAVYADIDGPH